MTEVRHDAGRAAATSRRRASCIGGTAAYRRPAAFRQDPLPGHSKT
ncbi:hypothetical protein AB4089_22900 [Arthrobacter sp. 2MCAF15]